MKPRLLRRIIILVFAVSLPIFMTIAQVTASGVEFFWESIDVVMDVQPNGDFWVTETQHYQLTPIAPTKRYRYIPLDRIQEIKDVSVTENGQNLNAATETNNRQFWIRWQHSLNPQGSHIFVLKYRVVDGLHASGDKAQVYWQAIFPDRAAIVQSGTVTVHLPDTVTGPIENEVTNGFADSSQTPNDHTLKFVMNGNLPPGKAMTVKLTFPATSLDLPQRSAFSQWQLQIDRILRFISDNFFWLIGVLIFIGFLLYGIIEDLWSRRCPQCHRFTLKTTTQLLVAPTPQQTGNERVTHECRHCTYYATYEQPVDYATARGGSSSDWHGGGGYGGGYGGGGSSGGGGDGGGGGG